MLRRRRVGLEGRLEPVEDLPAPDEVVVRVVVRIARDEQPHRTAAARRPAPTTRSARRTAPRRGRHACARLAPRLRRPPAGLATAAARPVPSAEQRPRQRVLQERRVQERVHEQRREGGGHRHARRRDSPARPIAANSRHSAATTSARYAREADRALLGGDRHRDRVRGVRRALGRGVLAPGGTRAGTIPSRSRAIGLSANRSPAALDEVVATARRVRPPTCPNRGPVAARPGASSTTATPTTATARRRRERPPDAPPQRADHREPDEQRAEATTARTSARARPQQREHDRAGERGRAIAPSTAPPPRQPIITTTRKRP